MAMPTSKAILKPRRILFMQKVNLAAEVLWGMFPLSIILGTDSRIDEHSFMIIYLSDKFKIEGN